MCGFAGAVVWDERYRVSADGLARMGAAVAHRGPDGAGQHLSRTDSPITPATPQVALAFRRLAILDPDPRSMQPFTDGRRWLVFNGEIYNFRELRAELSDRNAWRTTGDTEVLLAAYAAWGPACVDRLNGMFAFAVWDEVDKVLFLARDRMGQKPLYISSDPDGRAVAFGSEIAAVRAVGWGWQRPHTNVVSYLCWGYELGLGTAFDGIWQLPPGGVFRANPRAPDCDGISRWAGPLADTTSTADDSAAVGEARRLVIQAVHRQLVTDVPLGVFLSGGVDSAVVAAAARQAGPVETFSIGFGDSRYDETAHAVAVAKHLGTRHHVFRVTPDAAADLPRLAAVFGEPFADSSALPTQYLARETRRTVKVALSGDGGDELFGGYDRYRAMRLARQLDPLPRRVRSAVRAAGNWLPSRHPKGLAARLRRFTSTFDLTAAERYAGLMRLFDDRLIAELLGRPTDNCDEIVDAFTSEQHERPEWSVVQVAAAVDRGTYLPDDLLTKVDRCSMLHGLEVRSPFMDPDVVTFAAGLTTDQLLKGGPKRMLREAFADELPAWVFRRRKMGFAVPVGDWFRGPLRAMLRDTLFSAHAFGRSHFDMAVVRRLVDEHEAERADHGQRLYALLMLELWWDTVRAGPAGTG